MQYTEFDTLSPSKPDFSGYAKGRNKVPAGFMALYFVLSVVLCYFYHKKIVGPVDWNALNSIDAVASFQTAKPYQFRLLIPLFFYLFKPLYTLYGKYLYSAYNVVIVFWLLIVYSKLLRHYFKDKKYVLWLTPVILYPILWNYVILNQSFQYYDFTAILIFTIGLYFIVTERFGLFLFTFIVGMLNKETAGYLIFAYMMYNYESIFTRKVIDRVLLLGGIFIAWKLLLNYIFSGNSGDSFEVGFYENIRIVKELFSNRILLKNLALNFGGLYIFVILLFVTGAWEKFPNKKLLYINLVIIPYYIFGIYITYITEIRVYTELIPMITTLFLIYLSTFERIGLKSVSSKEQTK